MSRQTSAAQEALEHFTQGPAGTWRLTGDAAAVVAVLQALGRPRGPSPQSQRVAAQIAERIGLEWICTYDLWQTSHTGTSWSVFHTALKHAVALGLIEQKPRAQGKARHYYRKPQEQKGDNAVMTKDAK